MSGRLTLIMTIISLSFWYSSRTLSAQTTDKPMLPVGTVIMCESRAATGFNWRNGNYVPSKFEDEKRLFRKAPNSDCPAAMGKFEDYKFDTDSIRYQGSEVCIKHNLFGEEIKKFGDKCLESITATKDSAPEHSISCEPSLFIPYVRFSPNGLYHLAVIHGNLSRQPAKGEKDSQYVEWGLCSVVSSK